MDKHDLTNNKSIFSVHVYMANRLKQPIQLYQIFKKIYIYISVV